MALALAFRFLTLVLFFFTNGQDISARDLKVELGDQKQVDSKDEAEPYLTEYGDNKPNYAASYTTTKHNNHLSRHEKPNHQPYTSGYKISPTGHKVTQPNYIAGYRTHTHDSSEPYIAAYGNHEVKQTNYNSGYRTPIDGSNEPYITAYGTDHEAKQPSYIAGYRTRTHDSNGPYNSAYLGYNTHKHDSSGPYNSAYLGYTTHTHDKTYTQEPNEPSITNNGDVNEANQPYIAGYRSTSRDSNKASSAKENLKGLLSPTVQRREAFKVGFFTLEDIYVGNVMTLQFPVQEVSPFISRKEADSIPLSMFQFQSVLQLFSIPEDSPQAKSIRRTLEQCEDEPIAGETKICANSLESMLEFIGKVIGTDAKHDILSTSYPSPSAIPLQNYTILEVSRDIDAPKWVACHPLPYPYAIHYCHFIATGTKVFKVSLVGESNGDKIEALGLCHLDTSDWSPDHVIFKQLGIKAGKEAPVCHFFPVKHLLWIPQPSKATV